MPASAESVYKLIFENAPIGIVHFDNDGIITACNEQFVSIIGSTRGKLIGINMLDLPDNKVSESVSKALNGEKGYYDGHYKSILSGKVTPVKVMFAPIQSEERSIDGGVGLVEDLSEEVNLNRTLTKFRLGIDRSSNPIYITDLDGVIQYANPAFEKEYGFSPEEAIGKTPAILKSNQQGEAFYKKFWETIMSGKSAEGEMINQTKEGEHVNVHYSTNPIIDSDGEHLGYIAIQDNITERVEMEKKIRKSLKEKDVMLAEIHHRVKNNLAIVSGLLELERDFDDDERINEFIRKSQTRIKSMAIVHEKLYKSNSLASVNLRSYVDELIQVIENNWIDDGAHVNFDLTIDDIEININQAIPLSLIIQELVTLAVKNLFLLEQSKIWIDISEASNMVSLTISMDREKASSKQIEDESGSLGLSLVQILTQQLKGTYTCDEHAFAHTLEFEKNNDKGASGNMM